MVHLLLSGQQPLRGDGRRELPGAVLTLQAHHLVPDARAAVLATIAPVVGCLLLGGRPVALLPHPVLPATLQPDCRHGQLQQRLAGIPDVVATAVEAAVTQPVHHLRHHTRLDIPRRKPLGGAVVQHQLSGCVVAVGVLKALQAEAAVRPGILQQTHPQQPRGVQAHRGRASVVFLIEKEVVAAVIGVAEIAHELAAQRPVERHAPGARRLQPQEIPAADGQVKAADVAHEAVAPPLVPGIALVQLPDREVTRILDGLAQRHRPSRRQPAHALRIARRHQRRQADGMDIVLDIGATAQHQQTPVRVEVAPAAVRIERRKQGRVVQPPA